MIWAYPLVALGLTALISLSIGFILGLAAGAVDEAQGPMPGPRLSSGDYRDNERMFGGDN